MIDFLESNAMHTLLPVSIAIPSLECSLRQEKKQGIDGELSSDIDVIELIQNR
ncbi:hypothetical protein [Paenibacillus sp. NPDC057934]|uniref:hypothetical protein n=1 Tax=Paenibacillus sp. NPDC057934 TaxID=3346282 RepID=UPI0036DC95F5